MARKRRRRRRGATPSQLRKDIDSGRTGDKVRVLDPAAAPLGTDAEAAGTPTPPRAVERARRTEAQQGAGEKPVPTYGAGAEPQHRGSSYWPAAVAVLAVAAIAVAAIALAVT